MAATSPLSEAFTTNVAAWPASTLAPWPGLASCADGAVASRTRIDTAAVGLELPALSMAAARSMSGPGPVPAGICTVNVASCDGAAGLTLNAPDVVSCPDV